MSDKIEGLSDEMQAAFENLALPLQTFGRALPPEGREAWLRQVVQMQQIVAAIPQTHAAPQPEQDGAIVTDGDWRFVTEGGSVTISGYVGKATDIQIPSAIRGKPVTKIQNSAFHNLGLTSVAIPAGITSIGDSAFAKNSLTSVAFPDSVASIGKRAFRDNKISAVNFGKCTASIGDGAFEDNELTEVTTGSGVTSIGEYVFRGNRIASVNIGGSVASIGYGAFAKQQLTSVTIPDSVTSIGDSAFEDNQLTSVTIGSGVTNIGASAFEGNRLSEAAIPDSVTFIDRRAFLGNKIICVAMPEGVTIGAEAFDGNKGEADGFKLTLSADARSLTVTGCAAKNKDLHIPPRIKGMPVTVIADGAFESMGLTRVTIPVNVTIIGKNAFAKNLIAGALEIPESVTSIGAGAFAGNQITKAAVPPDTTVAPDAFSNNRGMAGDFEVTLTDNAGAVNITSYAGDGKTVHIPQKIDDMPVASIGHEAFAGKGLTAVTFDRGIASIGSNAFFRNLLSEVTIPDGVTEIGDYAFCENPLKRADIPAGIKHVGCAFHDDVALTVRE